MMKSTVLIFLLLLTSNMLLAQLLIGPKAGIQLATTSFSNRLDYSDSVNSLFKPGFNLGSVLNLEVNKSFSLQFELNYSLQGRLIKGVYDQYLKHKAHDHYLNLPGLLRYHWSKKRIKYFLNAGPSLSYWLGGSGKISSSSIASNDQEFIKYSISFKEPQNESGKVFIQEANRLQIGVDFGAGVQLPVKRGQKLMLEARYNLGHSYLGKKFSVQNNIPDYSDNLETSHSIINVSAAYVFSRQLNGWKRGKSISN
ncbi:hypothetical protein BH23BAC1_BH23BAC1_17420 [soil metagenome]